MENNIPKEKIPTEDEKIDNELALLLMTGFIPKYQNPNAAIFKNQDGVTFQYELYDRGHVVSYDAYKKDDLYTILERTVMNTERNVNRESNFKTDNIIETKVVDIFSEKDIRPFSANTVTDKLYNFAIGKAIEVLKPKKLSDGTYNFEIVGISPKFVVKEN